MNTDKIYAESIANEYAPKDTSKVVALRKLDHKAKLPANIAAYFLGIVGSLVIGVGMCLSMNIIGLAGFAAVGCNYFLYKKLLKKGKEKYAFEIIELAKEISDK